MPRNRRPLRRPPPLRVRLLPSLRRVLPAPLQRPARLAHQAHLALLLPLRPRPARLPPLRLAQKRRPVVATRRSNQRPESEARPLLRQPLCELRIRKDARSLKFSSVVWFRSSLDGLAVAMKRTSEPPH